MAPSNTVPLLSPKNAGRMLRKQFGASFRIDGQLPFKDVTESDVLNERLGRIECQRLESRFSITMLMPKRLFPSRIVLTVDIARLT